MAVVTRYKTEPLEAWQKMKEIRRERFKNLWGSHQEGKLRVVRQGDALSSLLCGLGCDFSSRIFGPYFGPAMKDTALLIKFHEAAEAMNVPGGEICSAMHHQIGQAALGLTTKNPADGSSSPVDLVLQLATCTPQRKTAQLIAQILGVPYFIVSRPFCDEPSQQNFKGRGFLVGQMEAAIEWLVKLTGRTYDDEKLIEAVKNEWESAVLLAQIIQLCRSAVPAPLDYHQLREMSYVTGMLSYDKRALEFNRALLEELQDKISRQVSAYGVETARLLFEAEDVFFAMDRLMAMPRKYGAILVGDRGASLRGAWDFGEDGSMVPAPSLRELDREVRTRRDALELLAELYSEKNPTCHEFCVEDKAKMVLGKARAWKADAVTLMLDIGCRGIDVGFPEIKQVLSEQGVPTFVFEGCSSDPRYYDEGRVREQLEVFLENLGLTRLDPS